MPFDIDDFAADKGGTDGVSDFADIDAGFGADLDRMDEASFDSFIGDTRREKRRFESNVTPNRTDHFELETGQFRAPDSGRFEPGGPPPDFDQEVRRYRADSGRFKTRPADHFDEPAEVRQRSLEPRG